MMQHLDLNNDNAIAASLANAKPIILLRSLVTFYGQLYKLKNFRDKVLQTQYKRP